MILAGTLNTGDNITFTDLDHQGGEVLMTERERTNLKIWFTNGTWVKCSTNTKVNIHG